MNGYPESYQALDDDEMAVLRRDMMREREWAKRQRRKRTRRRWIVALIGPLVWLALLGLLILYCQESTLGMGVTP